MSFVFVFTQYSTLPTSPISRHYFQLLGTGWQSAGPKHPESLIESQGALLAGTHFCIVSGFVGTIDQCSKSTYCKDVRDPNSSWIKQDDLTDGLSIEGTKLSEGLSHAGHTVVGSKLYLCGGVRHFIVGLSYVTCTFCQQLIYFLESSILVGIQVKR